MVVDTSALMAILLKEPAADRLTTSLEHGYPRLISAGTLAEALIVASGRGLYAEMQSLVVHADLLVVEVDARFTKRMVASYQRWGKGNHPARLNFGDCFSYQTAMDYGCPLLFVGNDFTQTDVQQA